MSRYRKVELHLEQLKELQSILSSMKTLSQLELHKLGRVTESQSAMVRMLEQTVTDFLMFFPAPFRVKAMSFGWFSVPSAVSVGASMNCWSGVCSVNPRNVSHNLSVCWR